MVSSKTGDASDLYKHVGDRLFKDQVNDLYDSLEKDDLPAANRLIGYIGDSKNLLALEPLAILLEHPDEAVRSNSALALGKIGDRTAIQPLAKALNDPSEKVKISVVTALGMFGDKSVIRVLESIQLSPEEPRLTNAVRNAVYHIDHDHSLDKISKETVSVAAAQQTVTDVPTPPTYLQYDSPIINNAPPGEVKNPIIAAVLSILIPGLGQVYNGESYAKGFLYLAGTYIGSILIIPGFIVWIYGICNAYMKATKINAGEAPANPSTMGRVLLYAIAAFLIPIIITMILAVVIAAYIFAMSG